MVDWDLTTRREFARARVCAVSYLNTVPLVWGMLRGAQQGLFDLSFAVPSECADRLLAGAADIGIVPVIECERHGWQRIPGAGIACRGPVRSILVVSKHPPGAIRTLAADASSRSSVQLARIILQRRYGAEPAVTTLAPSLTSMLAGADAALIIGDPALRLDPTVFHAYQVLDLGSEWEALTGLPMVFAMWAGKPSRIEPWMPEAFLASLHDGQEHINTIVEAESQARSLPPDLVRAYLTRHIRFHIGAEEEAGMRLFLKYAAELGKPVRQESLVS